ncbi:MULTISPECIES: N-acetylmuramic acid 6-phosphate etherase [Virgibacillus]|uniref:N-acetylmuramic acid 6-phosphate etherase n=1 Tax=Virgibacillus salarius TaxID=447199 RepID=A0A941DXB9_9BACI|nr:MULTISPECIES: N-acetylmuramic acid 6-phosphate etherase [Virgibacillus]MBR7795883.1 N-acetylmuramic acid 6-phosphate etherase [Virgibacillus salarius]NAZ08595.1 N-acetylmuramic acid 6-phosphate etherase [Agaribacter marinus]
MINLNNMTTEKQNTKTMNLDQMSVIEALKVMNQEDQQVAKAIEPVLPAIEQAVKSIISSFESNGRLIYIGAGTSGRLGVLDAAECPPTFGTPPEKVIGLIAGGEKAFTKAVEGAEDSRTLAEQDLKELQLKENDIVVGLAASGRTPYVIGALNYANSIGAKTVAIACNQHSPIGKVATVPIEVTTGPEVLSGSTRLKAATAQKLILNMLSTISMVGIGKVYKNLMVDLQTTNQKLETRALRIVMAATEVDMETAKAKLKEGEGDVKLAITMILLGSDITTAKASLEKANGHIRKTIQ